MKQSLTDWLADGKYLPEFMRDFHAQKRIFKRINEVVENRKKADKEEDEFWTDRGYPDWISAHIYTVDFFLWFMGNHGYTLQRNRTAIEFKDLGATMADWDKRQMVEFQKYMEEQHGK